MSEAKARTLNRHRNNFHKYRWVVEPVLPGADEWNIGPLTNQRGRGEVVNIGNPEEITILELAQRIKQLTGSASPITFHPLPEDDPRRRCPDIRMVERLTGWRLKISLEHGLARTITWFQKKNV